MRIPFKYVLAAFMVSSITAYFWGSAGKLPDGELNQILEIEAPGGLAKDTFTIVTYNIGYLSGMTNNLPVKTDPDLYTANLERIVHIFKNIQPDLIGLQEIDYGSDRSGGMDQLDSLLKMCQIPFAQKSINWDKNYVPFPYWPPSVHFGRMLSGQAILSKYPIDRGERIVLEKPHNQAFYYQAFYIDRLVQVAHISVGKKKVVILNIHLEAYDKVTRERQAEYLLEVYRNYARQYPVLLIGDFNARPPYASEIPDRELTIQMLMEEPELSAAISKQRYLEKEKDYFTFSSEQPYEKLDYIFYNADQIQMIDSYVAHEAGIISDHLPVVMRFRLLPD